MPGIPEIKSYSLPAAGDLPANTAQWQLDPDRAVLLVHDMQKYFLRPLPAEGLRQELVAQRRPVDGVLPRGGHPRRLTPRSPAA